MDEPFIEIIGCLGFVFANGTLHVRLMVHTGHSDDVGFRRAPSKSWSAELARQREKSRGYKRQRRAPPLSATHQLGDRDA